MLCLYSIKISIGGQEAKMVGVIEVKTVQDKFSIGYPKSGAASLKKGDVLKLE